MHQYRQPSAWEQHGASLCNGVTTLVFTGRKAIQQLAVSIWQLAQTAQTNTNLFLPLIPADRILEDEYSRHF